VEAWGSVIQVSGVKNGAFVLAALLFGALLIGVVPTQMDRFFTPGTMLAAKSAAAPQEPEASTTVDQYWDKTNSSPTNITIKRVYNATQGSLNFTLERSTATDVATDVARVKTSVAGITPAEGDVVRVNGKGFTPKTLSTTERLLNDAGYYYMLLVSIMVAVIVYVFARIRSS
jgi:hypothetical protein